MAKYVAYDYEEVGGKDNYWHIYTTDADTGTIDMDSPVVLALKGPDTPAMRHYVEAICKAVDDAVTEAERIRGHG